MFQRPARRRIGWQATSPKVRQTQRHDGTGSLLRAPVVADGLGERVAQGRAQLVLPPATEPQEPTSPFVTTLPVRVPVLALVLDAQPGDSLTVLLVVVSEQPDGGGRIEHVIEGEWPNPQAGPCIC